MGIKINIFIIYLAVYPIVCKTVELNYSIEIITTKQLILYQMY